MDARIEVTYYNTAKDSTNPYLVANLGLHIISMDMYLAKCKLIRKKDGSTYVAFPSEPYTDPKTGEKKWSNFFWFGKRTSDFFQSQALEAIKQHCVDKDLPDPTLSQPGANLGPSLPNSAKPSYPVSQTQQQKSDLDSVFPADFGTSVFQ